MTLDKALAENPILKKMAADDPKVKEVIDIGRRLEGMSRTPRCTRPAWCIAPGPITDYAPALQRGARRNHHAVEHEGGSSGSVS
jgi:DNA polymerase-3 subunit alpha